MFRAELYAMLEVLYDISRVVVWALQADMAESATEMLLSFQVCLSVQATLPPPGPLK